MTTMSTTEALPELPNAAAYIDQSGECSPSLNCHVYTADQMRDYARAALAAAAPSPVAEPVAWQFYNTVSCSWQGCSQEEHDRVLRIGLGKARALYAAPMINGLTASEPVKPMNEDELQDFCISLSFEQDDYTVEVIRAVEDRMRGVPLFVPANSASETAETASVATELLKVLKLYASTYNEHWLPGWPILEPLADAAIAAAELALDPAMQAVNESAARMEADIEKLRTGDTSGLDLDMLALAEQVIAAKGEVPAEPNKLRAALDITLTEASVAFLLEMMKAPDEPTELRFIVGDGHSGYGLYVCEAEYPEEGANFVQAIAAPSNGLMKLADEFELRRLLAEERATNRSLHRALATPAPAAQQPAELKRYEPAVVIDESRGRLTASGAAMEAKPDGRWVCLSDVLDVLRRYQWLRDKANWDVLPVDKGADLAEWRCMFHSPYGMHDETEDSLDAAIDAAIKAQGGSQ